MLQDPQKNDSVGGLGTTKRSHDAAVGTASRVRARKGVNLQREKGASQIYLFRAVQDLDGRCGSLEVKLGEKKRVMRSKEENEKTDDRL